MLWRNSKRSILLFKRDTVIHLEYSSYKTFHRITSHKQISLVYLIFVAQQLFGGITFIVSIFFLELAGWGFAFHRHRLEESRQALEEELSNPGK